MIRLTNATRMVSRPIWLVLGLLLLAGVAFLDYITGVELSFSLFYLLPISLIAWRVRERVGLVVAFLSAGLWLAVDVWSGNRYSHMFSYVWNAIIRLGFFLLPVFVIRLNRARRHEQELARTDFLTGVLNTRYFRELAQMEINRSLRYGRPFTVVYLDADNFKTVNDMFGHATGDTALQTIAGIIQTHVRKTDIVARMGGDEFVVLLTETDAQTAPVVISNMQGQLLKAMGDNGWPVTFSIGVLTVTVPHLSVDEMLVRADQLMYKSKNEGKNGIRYAIYPLEEVHAVKLDP